MTERAPRPPRLRRLGRTVKGFLLWEYERGSWQYDVMVALILAFVLLTPARYFRDQPLYSSQLGGDLVLLDVDEQGKHYRLSAQLLAAYHEDPRQAAEQVFRANLGHPVEIIRIQRVKGDDRGVAWYDVWVRENAGPGDNNK